MEIMDILGYIGCFVLTTGAIILYGMGLKGYLDDQKKENDEI